jgi:hypothetical protein
MTERRTIELLDELVSHGFTNAAFQRLHHRGKATTISAHRKYAEKVEFKPNDTNEMVQRRLAFVLKAYHHGTGDKPTDWLALAAASVNAIPR